jgi:mannose-6-phosphate isomerase
VTTTPVPMLLPNNQFDHFYRGGDRIKALRGGPGGPQRPEEWIASATTRAGQALQGLSTLPSGELLRDAVRADPTAWLGPAHVERYGGEGVELLVKLLDAGQRLPVHVHPTRAFAREHLGLAHGKTEAWVVVESDPGAVVGIGLRRPMTREELGRLVAAHDSAALVDAVHPRQVRPGDAILVPSGTAHFIGEGILVTELQEPTDLSILLEWDGFAVDGDAEGHLGLGFDVALDALDLAVWSDDDVARAVRRVPWPRPVGPALPEAALPYFRADWVAAPENPFAVAAGFSVFVVLDGSGTVRAASDSLDVRRGDVALIPYAVGQWTLDGVVAGLLCRPPAPHAPEAPR